jgi:hypothetical protein
MQFIRAIDSVYFQEWVSRALILAKLGLKRRRQELPMTVTMKVGKHLERSHHRCLLTSCILRKRFKFGSYRPAISRA